MDYSECFREINLSTFRIVSGEHLSLSEEKFLIDRLPSLKQKIIKHLNTYLFEMLCFDTFKYYIVDSWFVKIAPGGESIMHDHANSLYSGVVYIDVDNTTKGGIRFQFSNFGVNNFGQVRYDLSHKEYNLYNSKYWELYVENGDIFIFPSGLHHQTLKNISNNYRYSFSFNVLPYNYKSDELGGRVY
jgi:uncharacterized protein (TIGR02466 family)